MIWVSSSVLIPSTILLLLLVHESNCDLSEEDNPSSDWYIDLADYFLYNTLIVSDDKEVKRFGFSDKTTQLVMLPQLRLLIAALEKQAKELRWSLKSQSTGTNEQAIKHIEALLETNMKDTKKEALRKKLAQFEAIKKMREENLKNHVPELVITALDVIEKFVKANTVELSKPDFKKELDMLNGRVEELRALQAMLASLKVPHATVVPDPFAGVQKPKIMWPNSSVIQREVQLQIELYNKYTDVLGSKVLFFRKIKTLKTEMMKERCVIYENVRALIESQKELNVNERMEELLKLLDSSITQKSKKFQQIMEFAVADKDAIEQEVTELGNAIKALESKVRETRKEIADDIRESKLQGIKTVPKAGTVRFAAPTLIEIDVDTYREIVDFILENITEEGSVLKKYVFDKSMANQLGINSGKWNRLIGNGLGDWKTVKNDDKQVQARLKTEIKGIVDKINKLLYDSYSKPELKANQEISFKLDRLAIKVQELDEKLSVVKKAVHELGRMIGL